MQSTDPPAASLSADPSRALAGTPPIEARGLIKRYGHVTAVDNIDLTVQRGDVYGFLGPNGAGKTTTLRMLLGLIRPDAGVAGFVEAPRFYPYMSGRRNLELVAALDGGGARDRIDGALDTVELADRQGDKVGGYSHGMRQRLGIAGALIRHPALLILDEPTTGLDPAGMRDMRVLVRRLADQGITVLLSSHIMDEVEELCDRLAIVRSGSVIYEGRLDELLHSTGQRYRLRTTDDERALEVATHQPGVGDVRRDGDGLSVAADEDAAAGLSIALVDAGLGIRALVPAAASLEELFFRLTEGETNGAAPSQERVPA